MCGPWEETCDRLNTCFWGYNLKQLGQMFLETPQWWQTWGLTKDLKLAKIVLDFIPLSPISDWNTKTVIDPEAMENEGLEETTYPKPVLSELGF